MCAIGDGIAAGIDDVEPFERFFDVEAGIEGIETVGSVGLNGEEMDVGDLHARLPLPSAAPATDGVLILLGDHGAVAIEGLVKDFIGFVDLLQWSPIEGQADL